MLPTSDRIIVACRVEQILSGVPLDIFHVLWVAWEDCWTREIFIFVPLPNPNSLISGAGSDQVALTIEAHWFYFIFVAFKRAHWLKIIIVLKPHYSCSIEGSRRQAKFALLLNWTPFDLADSPRVSAVQSRLALAVVNTPQLDSFVRAASCNQIFVVCEVEGPNAILMPFQSLDQFNHNFKNY